MMRILTVLLLALCLFGATSAAVKGQVPTDGLTLHLDASAITGLADGDLVHFWPDSSGNGRDADVDVPVDNLRQPTYRAAGINGVPSVYFGGPGIGMDPWPWPDGVLDLNADRMRVVPVGGATMVQEAFVVATLEEPYSGDGSNGFEFGCCATLFARHFDGQVFGVPWHTRTIFNVDRFAEGGEINVNGADSIDIIDGPMIVDVTTGAPRDMGTLVVGAEGYPSGHDRGSRAWHGHIAEVIMYDHILTDAQREEVGGYLAQKYGIETLYPLASPLSDLTRNGFVDFEDLTTLLANWNKDVTAAEGNLVEPLTSVVNFADLTFLLADWTGPGPAGAPDAALGEEAVPEPSSLLLAVIATLGLSFGWRRRRAF